MDTQKLTFENFFDLTTNMLCVVSMEGIFLEINSAWITNTGWTRQELLSKPIFDFIHVEDRSKLIEAFELLKNSKVTNFFQNRFQNKDGSYDALSWKVTVGSKTSMVYVSVCKTTKKLEFQENDLVHNEILRRGVKHIPICISVQNQDLVYSWIVNSETVLDGQEFIGKTDQELFPDQASTLLLELKKKVLASQEPLRTRLELFDQQHPKTFDVYIEPLESKNLTAAIVTSYVDISNQITIENSLRESENRFRGVFESASAGMALVSLEGILVQVNQALANMLKTSSYDLIGKSFRDIKSPQGFEREEKYGQEMIEGQRNSYNLEKIYISRTGEEIKVLINVWLVRDSQNHPTHFAVQLIDQTSVEQVLEELTRYKLAVDNSTDAITFTDIQGLVLYVNSSWEKLTQYSLEEVKGKNPRIIKSGKTNPAVYKKLWETIKQGKVFISEDIINQRKDGSEYYAETSIFPIIDEGEAKFYVGIQQDISKRKEVDQMKTDFISLASHQLRTPLTGMKWNTEMLLEGDMGELTDKQHYTIRNIYTANERLIHLVNDLLDISRIESGRLILDTKTTDLAKLVQGVIEELFPLSQRKHQKIEFNCADQTTITCDPKLMRNVILNLLSNAVKYSQDSGKILIELYKDQEMLTFKITDNGMGIPENEQDRIFDKFFRGSNIVKSDVEGSGLGMYLVKAIVESSNGKIWFESKENQGTTFWLTLPTNITNTQIGNV